MQYRGSSDSRATADSHCETQGSRNEVKCHGNASAEMSFNLGKSQVTLGEGFNESKVLVRDKASGRSTWKLVRSFMKIGKKAI